MGSAERQEIRRAVWGMAAGAGFLGCLSSLYLFSWANLSQSLSRPAFLWNAGHSSLPERSVLRALEPAPRAATEKPQKTPSPSCQWSRTGTPRHLGSGKKQLLPSCSFVPFPTKISPGEANPSSSAGLNRKFLSARGRGQLGEISSHRFPPEIQNHIKVLSQPLVGVEGQP